MWTISLCMKYFIVSECMNDFPLKIWTTRFFCSNEIYVFICVTRSPIYIKSVTARLYAIIEISIIYFPSLTITVIPNILLRCTFIVMKNIFTSLVISHTTVLRICNDSKMFSWLIPNSLFTNKCLKTETGIDACAYFINETNQYGKLLYLDIFEYYYFKNVLCLLYIYSNSMNKK